MILLQLIYCTLTGVSVLRNLEVLFACAAASAAECSKIHQNLLKQAYRLTRQQLWYVGVITGAFGGVLEGGCLPPL